MDGVQQAIGVNEQYGKYVKYFLPNPNSGHGVIVGHYLITAAHVVSHLQKVFFEFEGEYNVFTMLICRTNVHLKEGSSGSPIISKYMVYLLDQEHLKIHI